jgi:hypothetical protein
MAYGENGNAWRVWDRKGDGDKEETKMGTEWERRVGRCIRHGVGNLFLGFLLMPSCCFACLRSLRLFLGGWDIEIL